MPLTPFQAEVCLLLAPNRTEDSHLAGGAGLHFQPDSIRYSEDLDYFHDSEVRVASAFQKDRQTLEDQGYKCLVEMNQPGYIRCVVQKGSDATKIEWAQDSSWRFMPVQFQKGIGCVLHPIDLSINKVLALAGRDEARDYLDVLEIHGKVLSLGALVWAACGKDPGFSPHSLLEILKRRGKYRPEEFDRLHLNQRIDVQELKTRWIEALSKAEKFIEAAPPEQIGALYYSQADKKFVTPDFSRSSKDISPHFGKQGGVIPRVL